MQLTAARQALSIPGVVAVIVEYCALSVLSQPETSSKEEEEHHGVRPARLPRFYSVLLTTCLVSRTFLAASLKLLSSSLVFVHGTDQLNKWLDSIGVETVRTERRKNEVVYLTDPFPFKPGKQEGGYKWDYEVVGKVLVEVEGCQELYLAFMGQRDVPAEWIACENLKNLKILQLGSPLAAPATDSSPPQLPFKTLSLFAPVESFHEHLSRDWSPTFHVLARSSVRIYHLNLSRFPLFANYLVPSLFPFASHVVELSLPHFQFASTSGGAFFVFAQACASLERLSISTISPASCASLHLLVAFPARLAAIKIDHVRGSFGGHHDWSERGQSEDVFAHLAQTLESMKTKSHDMLREIRFGSAKWFLPKHQAAFERLVQETGIDLSIDTVDNARTEEEQKEFKQIVRASLQGLVKAQEESPGDALHSGDLDSSCEARRN